MYVGEALKQSLGRTAGLSDASMVGRNVGGDVGIDSSLG